MKFCIFLMVYFIYYFNHFEASSSSLIIIHGSSHTENISGHISPSMMTNVTQVSSLVDVARVLTDLDHHDIVLSFTRYDGHFTTLHEPKSQIVYGLGDTVDHLKESLAGDSSYHSCHRHFLPYKLSIKSLLHSITEKHVAILTDTSYCSLSLLEDIKLNVMLGHDHTTLHVHQLNLEPNFHNNQSIKQQLLNFRTGNVHVFVSLVPEEYIQRLFQIANFFGLLDNYNVWVIPEYKDDGFNELSPVKTLRFSLLKNYEEPYKISSVIDSVLKVHQSFDQEQPAPKSYVIKSKVYEMIFKNSYADANHAANEMFEIEIQYRDREKNEHEWITTHAQINEHVFHLMSTQITILQYIQSTTEFKLNRLRIVTALDEPYVFFDDCSYDEEHHTCENGVVCRYPDYITKSQNYTGNVHTCCIGFIVDIFMLILKRLNLNYEMYIVDDGKYGAFKNNRWNGMVGDIVDGKADFAMAGLTITKDRSEVVEFTTPFMYDKVGIITRPQVVDHGFLNWQFIEPLSSDLQLFLLSFFLSGIVLNYLFENGVYISGLVKKGFNYGLEKYYPFSESMTYISGVTLQRDLGGVNPVRPGAMVSAVIFAFGMVIVVTTYTAVLAALLMQNHEKEPFQGSQDPRFRNPTDDFKFGVLKDSSHETFFKNAETDVLKRMGIFMQKYNYDLSSSGPEFVRNGTLQAIFSDYIYLHYFLSKDNTCQLKLVEDDLLSFGLGFAFKPNLRVIGLVNHVIQHLVDEEEVTVLRGKWFSNICQPTFFVETKIELPIDRFGGLVVLLIATIVISIGLLYPEILWYRHFHDRFVNAARSLLGGEGKYCMNRGVNKSPIISLGKIHPVTLDERHTKDVQN